MLITSLFITIWLICTSFAAGEPTSTSLPSVVDTICMKAPVACWPGTVARTQASCTDTCAEAWEVMANRPQNSSDRDANLDRIILLSFHDEVCVAGAISRAP